MSNQQAKFIEALRNVSPEEFKPRVEAAEGKVKRRKAIRAFLKQALVGLVIGLAIGGTLCVLTHYTARGGF
jgi:hypothetical protein